jgi:hypothetical protein
MYGLEHIYVDALYIMTEGGNTRDAHVKFEIILQGKKFEVKISSSILPWTWSPKSTALLSKKNWR